MIEEKHVMSPVLQALLNDTDLLAPTGKPAEDIVASKYRLTGSVVDPGAMGEIALFQQQGSSLLELGHSIVSDLKEQTYSRLQMGFSYRSLEHFYYPLDGYIRSVKFGPRGQVVSLEALSDMALHAFWVQDLNLFASPTQIVESLLAQLDIEDYEIELPTKSVRHTIGDKVTAFDYLSALRRTAKIPYPWFFTPQGKFVWKPWVAGETDAPSGTETYVFEYQKNITSMNPIADDLQLEESQWLEEKQATSDPAIDKYFSEKPIGKVFELETVLHPMIYPGIVVTTKYPDIFPGLVEQYRVDDFEHSGNNGQTRTRLTLRGIEA